jgi:hypothetical protein
VLYHLEVNTRFVSFTIEAGIFSLKTIFSYSFFASSGAFIFVV